MLGVHERQTTGMDLASLTPLDGGWSGETFLAEVAGERSVVRIYARPSHRGAAAHEVDAALLRLVQGPAAGPRGPGGTPRRRGHRHARAARDVVPAGRAAASCCSRGSTTPSRATLGRRLGEILADLGGMPMLSAGPFVDGRLTIGSFEPDLDGLPAAVELAEPRLGWWSPDELAGLREVAVDAQALLDTVGRRVLVHSDFNAKNLLVDPDELDGDRSPRLGVRPRRSPVHRPREPAAVRARRGVHRRRARGVHRRAAAARAGDALALARAADLWALVDLAARRGENPVAERADRLLRTVALRRDPRPPA